MESSSQDGFEFQVLEASNTNNPHDHAHYRILVKPGSEIKYLSFPGSEHPTDYRGHRLEFTTVPGGDWKLGLLKETPTGSLKFAMTDPNGPFSISPTWHPCSVDVSTIPKDGIRPNHGEGHPRDFIFKTTYRDWRGHAEVVINKHWEPFFVRELAQDTCIYSVLDGHDLTPEFLAHVVDGSRVIGYVLDSPRGRPAGLGDMWKCVEALKKIHALGIAINHISEHLFRVTDEGKVILAGFPVARKTEDPKAFELDIWETRKMLWRLWIGKWASKFSCI